MIDKRKLPSPPHFDILVLCNETILHICSMLIQRGGRNSNIKQQKITIFQSSVRLIETW